MKSKLLSLLLLYPIVFYGLSQQEMDEIALKSESVVTASDYDKTKGEMKPTGEMKLRRYLKDNYPNLGMKDIESIRKLVDEIKRNPRLKDKTIKNVLESAATDKVDSQLSLSDQEISNLAKEAKAVWDKNGNMGEFAARNFLRDEKSIVSKKELDAVVRKIMELKTSAVAPSRPRQPRDGSDSSPTPTIKVPAEVEEWAQKFKNIDPGTQRFKLIKNLNENNVDKGLWPQIMIRINGLRSEPSFVPSGSDTSGGSTDTTGSGVDAGGSTSSAPSSDASSGESKEEQSFDSIITSPQIKQMRLLFENNERAFVQFIQIMKFKINNNMNMLWQDLAVYFDLTTLERPSNRTEQILYDWVLKHSMNDVYKYDEV